MKTLEKDELFQNLQGFLKTKGVDLQQGSYSQTLQKGCALLSDAINTGQEGFGRAKVQIDKNLDRLRQIIHEKTAPPGQRTSAPPPQPAPAQETVKAKRKSKKQPNQAKRKPRRK